MKMPKPKKKEVYDVPDVIVLDDKRKDDELGKEELDNLGDDDEMDFDEGFDFDDGGD